MTDSGKSNQPWPVLAEHAPLLATVVAFLFLVVRVLVVSYFDESTALALISTAGVVQVVLGVLVQMSSLILLSVAASAAIWAGVRYRRGESFMAPLVVSIVIALALILFTDLIGGILVIAAIALNATRNSSRESDGPSPPASSGRRSERSRRRPEWFERASSWVLERPLVVIGGLYFGLLLVAALVTPAMWLPAESVTVETDLGGEATRSIGYVIDDSEPWTSVLTDASRVVVRIRSDLVVDRTVCTLTREPIIFTSLLALLREGENKTPMCSELMLEPN